MMIMFNPPLGETISFAPYSLLPHKQITPLLFTAQIGVPDYTQIVNEGGHLELWSDIPSQGNNNGAWVASTFLQDVTSSQSHSSAYDLSLRTSLEPSDSGVQYLYLLIALPPLEDGIHRFSFTYRIVYPSGVITWLGAFGQNGGLVLLTPKPGTLKGIDIPNTWSLNLERQGYVKYIQDESNEVEVIKVMKIENLANFRIWALGQDGFMIDLKDASVLILVPNTPDRLPVLYPTYVLAASPDANITISVDGIVTVSGTGNILLQVNDPLQEPQSFFHRVFRDSNLEGWNILATDAQSQLIALSPPPSIVYPIPAVVIPLWSSEQFKPLLKVETCRLAQIIAKAGVKEFAVILRNQNKMHIFNAQPAVWKTQTILLDFDHAGNDFLITPIYRLHISKPERSFRSYWGAAILSNHRSSPTSFPLGYANNLSPPSSPFARTVGMSPQPFADLNAEQISQNVGESQESPGHLEGPDQLEHEVDSPHSIRKEPNSSVSRESHVWVFRYLFASFNALIRFLFGHILRDHGSSSLITGEQSHKSKTINNNNAVITNDSVGQPIAEIAPDENLDIERTSSLAKSNRESAKCSPEESDPLASQSAGLVHHDAILDHSCSSAVLATGANAFYAELLLSATKHYDRVGDKVTSVDIVLLPLPDSDESGDNVNEEVVTFTDTSTSLLKTALEGAVTFIDEHGPLTCTVTPFQSFFAKYTERFNPISVASHLIRYQLGWEGGNKGKTISIASPLKDSSL